VTGGAVQAAQQFLAATVDTTPDTPAPVLFDQAAPALTQWENTPES
jgi:hypothetical protein